MNEVLYTKEEFDAMVNDVIGRLDHQVLATPTGELRNLLTDARNLLMSANKI